MAEGRKGEEKQGGTSLRTPPAATHFPCPAVGDDTDSDVSLLDISETGFHERIVFTAERTGLQMDHGRCVSSNHNESESRTERARSFDNVDSGYHQHDYPHRNQQNNHNPQSSHNASGTFSQSFHKIRQNPFDFPARDSVSRTVVQKPNSGTGNSAVPEGSGFDQYDPINFGDPTFVNSYSTTPSSLLTSRQNPAYFVHPIIPSSWQGLQTGTPILPHLNTSSGIAPDDCFPDSSLKSTPVYCSDLHQFPTNNVEPNLQGTDGKARTDNQFLTSSNLSKSIQRDLLDDQPNKSSPALTCSAAPTGGRIGSWVDNSDQNDKYQNPDLIIRDYTSSPSSPHENNKKPSYYSHIYKLPQIITDNGFKYDDPVNSESKNNPQRSVNCDKQGYMKDLQPNVEPSVNLRMSLGERTDLKVDGCHDSQPHVVGSISDNRFADACNLNSRPLHSLVKERTENGLRVGNMHSRLCSWDDEVNEDRFLEETPLLESVVKTDNRCRISSGVRKSKSGTWRDFASHTPHAGEKPGVASHATDNSLEYHANLHQRSNYSDSATEDHQKNGGHDKHAQVDVDDSWTPTDCAARNNRGMFERNSYGDFSSPLPHFLENNRIGHSGSGALSSSTPFRHCHKRKMTSLTDKLARRQLISVVVLCLLFMIGEAVGGFLANSLALFTDVLHLGSDLISFIISLLAMWLANKPATKKMSFGYHRAEVIGALLSVLIIWLVSGVLCYIAVDRIIHEHYKSVRADEMLITASLGVLFNIIMGFVLHSEMCCGHAHSHSKFGHGHSHGSGGHGHSHTKDDLLDVPHEATRRENISTGRQEGVDYQHLHHENGTDQSDQQMMDVNCMGMANVDEELSSDEHHAHAEDEESLHKHKNINVRAAFIHVIGDIIQSLGVLIAALIIKFTTDERYRLADPICTFLFSLLVLITTITVLRDALLVIMEGVPRDLSIDSMRKELAAINGVVTVHSLHIWALTLDRNALSAHLVVENTALHDQVLSSATKLIQDKHHFFHSTIQVELLDEIAMKNCQECMEWT